MINIKILVFSICLENILKNGLEMLLYVYQIIKNIFLMFIKVEIYMKL